VNKNLDFSSREDLFLRTNLDTIFAHLLADFSGDI
jgi:hypothetical protein